VECDKCKTPAVTFIRYSGQHLCGEHFVRFFEKRAKHNVTQQGRLPEGIVAIALSGGKDSVACLHFLHKIVAENPRIFLEAISIDEGIAGYRETALDIAREQTTRLGVPWHVVATKELAGYSIDEYAQGKAGPSGAAAKTLRIATPDGKDRPSCGPCGVFRRQGLNRVASKIGAAAIATGHNLDDNAQTILMNVLNGDVDRLERLAPHDTVQDGMVPRILPFHNIPEKEVLLYCMLEGLPIHDEAECPYAERANRFAMRDILLGLENDQPGTRHGLLKFQEKLKAKLPSISHSAKPCPVCAEGTSGDVCRACLWKA
jgi:uncharacterized protein (TIGR00269 family)